MHIFSTGVSGLFASQAGIDVTGHNISNVNTEGYSRQRVSLNTMSPEHNGDGLFGRGVNIEGVERVYDDMIASSIRNESADLKYFESIQKALAKTQVYFNELEDGSGLGEAIQQYYDAWGDLANTAPDQSDEALIKRKTLLEKADILADKIRAGDQALKNLQAESNFIIEEYVGEINQIAENISYLNKQIAVVEATGQTANDFRDQRQALLNRLGEMANITVHERTSGQVAVYVGGNALVDEVKTFQITAEKTDESEDVRIMWGTPEQQKSRVDITDSFTSGEIGAEVYIRDELLDGYADSLNELASTMIEETNRVHAIGQGTQRLTQVTSANGVTNPTYTLAEEAGAFPAEVYAGTLRITVYDENGNKVDDYDVEIDPEVDNLNSIINKISASDGDGDAGAIQASISLNNSLKITAGAGYTFAFTEDTSNFLVASGTYGFFGGSDASNIEVSGLIKTNSAFIATSKTGAPGDNQNASAIADIKQKSVFNEGTISIDEFYSYFAASIGSDKQKADTYVATKQQAINQLELKLEEVKGVSMDEEMTNLMKFQRAFEASARFITTVDEMLNKLVNGLGTGGR
jgi:flagellar hook-associated protein 1 FlgK